MQERGREARQSFVWVTTTLCLILHRSGWDPNACKMSYTTNLKSGWTNLTQVGNDIAYDTQAAAILKIEGTKQTTYLYVGDRWQDLGLPESKTIIFPISFKGTSCSMDYRERFDVLIL